MSAFVSYGVSSERLGGLHRTQSAKRDRQGRLMPNDEFLQSMWKLDPEHGRAGGQARIKKVVRNSKGKFAKNV